MSETQLPQSEIEKFKDALHLFPENNDVHKHNTEKLENLRDVSGNPVPIARIPAKHNCPSAAGGSLEDAEGLAPVIYLAKGAKIMLRTNLWTSRGLENGTIGEIVDILYEEGSNPPEDPPAILICKFDTYKGPYLDETEKTVPIVPSTKFWTRPQNTMCSRTNFPVALAYACSIHKSQSLSLDKVMYNTVNNLIHVNFITFTLK